MLSRTFLFGYLFCLFACSSSDLPLVFVSERDVEFDVLDDSVSFGLPIGFCGNARKLYVSDFYGDLLLHEYDLRDKTVERFGYKGKGPGELLPPVLIHMNDTALLAHSKGSFSLGYFPLKDGEKKFTPICRLPTAVSTVILLDRDRILASGFFEQGRYAVLDRAGEEQTYFGTYPDFTERDKKASPAAKAMFHQVSFCARPAGGKVAAVSGYVLDILDCSGDLRVVKRLQLHDYDYRYEDGRVVSAKKTEETPDGVLSVTASDQYIYTVFKSLPRNGKPCYEVWIFDWDGNPVEKWRPDRRLDRLIWNGTTLYGMDSKKESGGLFVRK